MILVMFLAVSLALMIGPWFVPNMDPLLQVASLVAGACLALLVAVVAVITRLYRKASANMAFVRTGMGGARVIKDAGTIVAPVIHQVIPVSLQAALGSAR